MSATTKFNMEMQIALEKARKEFEDGAIIGGLVGTGLTALVQRKRSLAGTGFAAASAAGMYYNVATMDDEAIIEAKMQGVDTTSMAIVTGGFSLLTGIAGDLFFGSDKG